MAVEYHRTNINLYKSDVEYLKSHYGYGWGEIAREAIHNYVFCLKNMKETNDPIDYELIIRAEEPSDE